MTSDIMDGVTVNVLAESCHVLSSNSVSDSLLNNFLVLFNIHHNF